MVVVHNQNNSREPEKVEAVQIPTYTDIQAEVAAKLVVDVQRGMTLETSDALVTVFTTTSRTDADLFDFIAFAQACHAAADVMRKHGNLDAAGLYFAMGQDLLTKAAEAYSALVAAYAQTQPQH